MNLEDEARQQIIDLLETSVRGKLKELGYDFKGKRPGSAVHMAWVAVDKQKHKSGDT